MVPNTFEYKRPSSLDEAIQMLASDGDAKILAGGHSLLPAMKLRLNSPGTLIDIGRLTELKYIRDEGDSIAIGAGTTHGELANSGLIQRDLGLFSEVAEQIGDIQVRNAGTIGGSLAHADPAADWPAAVVVAGATLGVQGPNGKRQVKAEDFFKGLFWTDLAENEILTEVRVPKAGQGTHYAYAKFSQPASRFALVGCAVMFRVAGGKFDNVRVAFNGLSGHAFRDHGVENSLSGNPTNADSIAAAAAQAGHGVEAMSDHYASPDYRLHLARVYAKRALTQALK